VIGEVDVVYEIGDGRGEAEPAEGESGVGPPPSVCGSVRCREAAEALPLQG
jgi:hypothetical protein